MSLQPAISAEQLAANTTLLKTVQYSIAKSILSSYSGDFDWLAEILQNSIDSLQRRWEGKPTGTPVPWAMGDNPTELPDDVVPRLRLVIYRSEDRVVVIDNGVGLSLPQFSSLAVPFSTDKPPSSHERGQKGVGLKYLMYAHNLFSIASKQPPTATEHDEPLPAGLLDSAQQQGMTETEFGFSWRDTRKLLDAVELPATRSTPDFPPLLFSNSLASCLSNVASGVAVEVCLDADTEHGRLSRRNFSSIVQRWEHILRTKTAAGNVDIEQDLLRWERRTTRRDPHFAWLERLVVELFLVEGSPDSPTRIDRPRDGVVVPEFEYPHTLVPPQTISRYRDLLGTNATAEYEALYEFWSEAEFATRFKSRLDELIADLPVTDQDEESEDNSIHLARMRELMQVREQLDVLRPEVYAAYGWHNRYWENRGYRRVTGKDETRLPGRDPDDPRSALRVGFESTFRGGVLLAGGGMPMANTMPHPIEILPQDGDRLFVLVAARGHLQLDLGRKVPHSTDHAMFIREVDDFVYRYFTQQSRLILKRNLVHRGQTPQGADVANDLERVLKRIRDLEDVSLSIPRAISLVFPRRAFLWPELEVEAVFTAWVTRNLLPGLRMRGIVGYVAPLDLILEAVPADAIPTGFPVDLLPADPTAPCKNPVWAETKVLLSDLIVELLDTRKPGKDLQHIDLVVVRDLDVLRLLTRVAERTDKPELVLAESDLSLQDAMVVEEERSINAPASSALAVTLKQLDRGTRCFSGTQYVLEDNLGNRAEVLVLEQLAPLLEPLLTSS